MDRDARPPHLHPPPRVATPAARRRPGVRRGRGGRPSGLNRSGLTVLFGILILSLIGVFLVLPRWTAGHRARASLQAPSAPQTAGDEAVPIQPAAATVPPTRFPTPRSTPATRVHRRGDSAAVSPAPSQRDGREFIDAMSRGLAALDAGQVQVAREAFETASRLRPDAPEIADGLARVAAAERRDLVTAGIDQGLELERSERWAEAEQAYARVLTVDPESAAALEGRERAARRSALDEQLVFHIRNPGRLSSPSVFDDATDLLDEAGGLSPRGHRLELQLSQLDEALKAAATPVAVILESDDATDVVVYRVGRLGTFTRRELSLRPGSYTAVGSREGFRDIRVRFEVTPRSPQRPIAVVCVEEL